MQGTFHYKVQFLLSVYAKWTNNQYNQTDPSENICSVKGNLASTRWLKRLANSSRLQH